MSRKRYYLPGVDEIHQLEETPASKAITERNRFIITVVVSALATVARLSQQYLALWLILANAGTVPQPALVPTAVFSAVAEWRLTESNKLIRFGFCGYACHHTRKSFLNFHALPLPSCLISFCVI